MTRKLMLWSSLPAESPNLFLTRFQIQLLLEMRLFHCLALSRTLVLHMTVIWQWKLRSPISCARQTLNCVALAPFVTFFPQMLQRLLCALLFFRVWTTVILFSLVAPIIYWTNYRRSRITLLAWSWESLKLFTSLPIWHRFIGYPSSHGYSSNSLPSATLAWTQLFLLIWMISWKFTSQLANYDHPQIIPFSAFLLWEWSPLVRDHSLMLPLLSGTQSLSRQDHLNPSLLLNHPLRLTFSGRTTDLCLCWCVHIYVCVCVCLCKWLCLSVCRCVCVYVNLCALACLSMSILCILMCDLFICLVI